jgi:hypothetical protein
MPACRAPRALRRADVEPKPYLVVACVGLTFDASACDALVFAVRCRATRASFRYQRVRCSRFCRAVSCHSCLLSIPARAMLSFLPCGVVPLVPVCAMLPSLCCVCRCTRPAMTRVLLGRGRGREVHVVGGRHEQEMFVRAAGREAHGWWGIAMSRHCVCEAGGGARREAHVAGDRRVAGTACVRRAGAHGDKQAHTACVH